jgi:DNA polymerase III sliding clamp (beta) subunit (PCNA family)
VKLKLSESKNKFSFICAASDMKAAISKVEAVTNYSGAQDLEKSFILAVYNKDTYLIGYSPDTFVVVKLKATEVSQKDGSVEINTTNLSGLISGRAELNFEYDGSRLNVSGVKGKYSCSLLTTPVTDTKVIRVNKLIQINSEKAKSLDSDTLTKLRSGIKLAELKDIYSDSGKTGLLCLISMKDNVLTINSFDNFHLSLYRSKVSSKDSFKLAIPEQTFTIIEKFLTEETGVKFFISDTGLRVQNDQFVVVLPPVQVEDNQYSQVSTYLKTLDKPSIKFSLSKDAVTTVSNMLTLAGKDSRFEFSVIPNGVVKLGLSVDGGDIKDMFKCKDLDIGKNKKPVNFKVDPRLFVDLFRKLKGEQAYPMELHFSKDQDDAASCFVTRCSIDKESKLVLLGTYHV